jgi:Bacterial SH3 domain
MKLPKIENLIILMFFAGVALWAVSKCSDRRSDMVRKVKEFTEEGDEDRPARRDTIYVPKPVVNTQGPPTGGAPPLNPPSNAPAPAGYSVPPAPAPAKKSAATPATTSDAGKYATLYVTIDGLKMRKKPGLKGELVAQLDLYEQVYFLNQKSEKPEEISLGLEKVTDHWVKVRTKSGKEGWVFGAGVHYYKTKRKGVIE